MYSDVERRVSRLVGRAADTADTAAAHDGEREAERAGGAPLDRPVLGRIGAGAAGSSTASGTETSELRAILAGRRIGLEKESLRVRPSGALSQLDHPEALGAALTNPSITTDFSEALLEMVTPPCASSSEALEHLAAIHRFILSRLPEGEHLWNTSMPCILHGEEAIRIGEYGSSHLGRMKHVYRRGLGARYGRRMQAIAGIHFNFSLPDEAWWAWQELHGSGGAASDGIALDDPLARLRTAGSFSMMRNLMRVGWLVPYLFGASPAICQSFLAPGEGGELATLNDSTRYAPYGTSLRMGNIGYRYRDDQPIDLSVRHTRFDRYVADIVGHVTTVHPPYEALGVRDADGRYRQLNACRLQIENEFYSSVRPKQIPERGEMPILALERRGIRYLELRSVDVSIEHPHGIDAESCAALELLMLFAWLGDDRALEAAEMADISHNVRTVAHRGREPGLVLRGPRGEISLADWGRAVVDALEPLAAALDAGDPEAGYAQALAAQRAKLEDTSRTPSARILEGVRSTGSYFEHTMRRSREQHAEILARTPDAALEAQLAAEVAGSIETRALYEARDRGSFEEFLADYFAQLPPRDTPTPTAERAPA